MMQSEVLPAELHLVTSPTLPQARSYLFKQQSDLQEYDVAKGTRIRINIPRLQRSYLMKDSYIRFQLNIDFTTSQNEKLFLDRCGAFGLFDRIEVYDYLGGTLLEQTQNIPALATLLGDLNNGFMKLNGELQATQGYEGVNIQGSLQNDHNKYEIRTSNSGMKIWGPQTSISSSSFYTVEFTLPVMSFLGIFSEKYIPLHNGFSVDFFLNDSKLAFVSRSAVEDTEDGRTPVIINDCWISNFVYCCQVMELGEQAESMVIATDPLVIPSRQYRYFSDLILSGAQSNFRLDMNLNVVSLRGIRFDMRPTVYQSLSYPSYGHRIRNFLENFNFQYGSSYLPEIAGISTRALTVPTSRLGFSYASIQQSATASSAITFPFNSTGKNKFEIEQEPKTYSITIAESTYTTASDLVTQLQYEIDLASGKDRFTVTSTNNVITITGNMGAFTLHKDATADLLIPMKFADTQKSIQLSDMQTKDFYRAQGYTQAYNELYKTTDPSNQISINKTEYMIDLGSSFNNTYKTPLTGSSARIPFNEYTGIDYPSICGKFAGGIDTRLSRKNTVSGIDTNGLLVSLNGSFDKDNVTNMAQSILDVWAEHDAFIQVIPGVATTVTF